jgi:hypothetical protein
MVGTTELGARWGPAVGGVRYVWSVVVAPPPSSSSPQGARDFLVADGILSSTTVFVYRGRSKVVDR